MGSIGLAEDGLLRDVEGCSRRTGVLYQITFGSENDPTEFFDFDPPKPPYLGTTFLGCGWGVSRLLCVLWALCVDSDLGPEDFFLVHGPPNTWQGSRVRTPGTPGRPLPPWALANKDLAVFTLVRLFSVT